MYTFPRDPFSELCSHILKDVSHEGVLIIAWLCLLSSHLVFSPELSWEALFERVPDNLPKMSASGEDKLCLAA